MNKKIITPASLFAIALIIVAAVTRLLPHPANVTPIMAIAIFGGAYFSKKYMAILVPLCILLVTDLVIGTHASMWAVYAAFIMAAGIGMILRNRVKISTVIGASLASSIVFFVVSNFGVWISGFCGYPMTFSGLLLCYEMAIPFFRNEVIGTLVYSAVMFGVFEYAKVKYPALAKI